jgi:hypothetical protein
MPSQLTSMTAPPPAQPKPEPAKPVPPPPPVPAVPAPRHLVSPPPQSRSRGLFADRTDLARGIIAAEVLGKPLALRDE